MCLENVYRKEIVCEIERDVNIFVSVFSSVWCVHVCVCVCDMLCHAVCVLSTFKPFSSLFLSAKFFKVDNVFEYYGLQIDYNSV